MQASRVRIPLAVPPWGEEEINEAIDSLRSGMLTMGKKVKRFEEMWAEYIGVDHAIMTNSGSSANLLALSALKQSGLLHDGDEVITPAVTWATTVFPIAQVGCIPVLVDVDRDTYNISPGAIVQAMTQNTRLILPVHLLGNPCEMGAIQKLAERYGVLVMEDACEAHGATVDGKKAGSFGQFATFSFFFSHHISTIEGGMVVTNNPMLAEKCRSMRAFGWIRDLKDRDEWAGLYEHIDPRFLFVDPGFNMRPTEIQGAFGIHQVPRLEWTILQRQITAHYWNTQLMEYDGWLLLPHERHGTRHVWFAYPIQVREGAPFTAKQLSAYLEGRGVETRPIEAGNMACQPAMERVRHRVDGEIPNARYIHENAFFIGNHQGIGKVEREAVAGYVRDFMREYR